LLDGYCRGVSHGIYEFHHCRHHSKLYEDQKEAKGNDPVGQVRHDLGGRETFAKVYADTDKLPKVPYKERGCIMSLL
jgi:hypothetical protein